MTNEQIKLVQDSFRQVGPIDEPAAQLIYARLFEFRIMISPPRPVDPS